MDEYSFPHVKVRRHTVTFGSRLRGNAVKLLGARELTSSITGIPGH